MLLELTAADHDSSPADGEHGLAAPAGGLLSNYPLFSSEDVDEAKQKVAEVFCPHTLKLALPRQHVHAQHNMVRLNEMTVNYLTYGAAVDIDPGQLQRFYLVQIPLAGHAEVQCGDQLVHSDSRVATLLNPDMSTFMRWDQDCEQVLLWIPREAIERRLAMLLGMDSVGSLSFAVSLPQHEGNSSAWCQTVIDLVRNLDRNGNVWLRYPSAVSSMEDFLLRNLLLFQPHNFTEVLEHGFEPARPRHLQRAIDYIQAHAAEPLTVAEIAQAACVSIRALEEGFKRHLNTTPMIYLRDIRLDLVRKQITALAALGQSASISDIAYQFGFTHLGRFAAYYKQRFGVSPSSTLRR